jgi:hypothetical protein
MSPVQNDPSRTIRPERVLRLALVVTTAWVVSCGGGAVDPDNELPFGIVDTPKAGAVLRPGDTVVGGWAMDDSGVEEIRIYFDGRFWAGTTLAVPRPDVARALPRYAREGDLHGWNVRVDFGLSPGDHTIIVQAVDDRGATRDIGVVPVTIPR